MIDDVFVQLARSVEDRDGVWRLKGPIVEVRPVVAMRGYNALDDLLVDDIRVLAACGAKPDTVEQLAARLLLSVDAVGNSVQLLMDSGFVCQEDEDAATRNEPVYAPTEIGCDVIRQIAIEALELDRYRMKGGLHESERLLVAARSAQA